MRDPCWMIWSGDCSFRPLLRCDFYETSERWWWLASDPVYLSQSMGVGRFLQFASLPGASEQECVQDLRWGWVASMAGW